MIELLFVCIRRDENMGERVINERYDFWNWKNNKIFFIREEWKGYLIEEKKVSKDFFC